KQLPAAVSSPAISAVGDAFMEGLRVGCYVVAAACLLASIAAFLFLPAHDRPDHEGRHTGHPQARTPQSDRPAAADG
ncbi:MAG: MFS transporter, partial [Actinobacteria bacterium]|nr:MFS transporter [Actinomycetota bacterium]